MDRHFYYKWDVGSPPDYKAKMGGWGGFVDVSDPLLLEGGCAVLVISGQAF